MGQGKDMGITEKHMENKAINKMTQRHEGRELGPFLMLLRTSKPSNAKPRLEEAWLKRNYNCIGSSWVPVRGKGRRESRAAGVPIFIRGCFK